MVLKPSRSLVILLVAAVFVLVLVLVVVGGGEGAGATSRTEVREARPDLAHRRRARHPRISPSPATRRRVLEAPQTTSGIDRSPPSLGRVERAAHGWRPCSCAELAAAPCRGVAPTPARRTTMAPARRPRIPRTAVAARWRVGRPRLPGGRTRARDRGDDRPDERVESTGRRAARVARHRPPERRVRGAMNCCRAGCAAGS